MATLKIDGKEYNLDEMSENARAQAGSLQVSNQKISQLQFDLAVFQTARLAYARDLAEKLPEPAGKKKKDLVTIDNKQYSMADFSDEAKAVMGSVRFVDQRLAQLQAELAIAQTARNAYAMALKAQLEQA